MLPKSLSLWTETKTMRRLCGGFTIAELLVSIAVLTLLVILVSSMVNSAASIATRGSKRMDADSQVRPVLDRMAYDFSQMIKRPDVDYYVKSPLDLEVGNDRIAFFCNASGFYPPGSLDTQKSPVSLVAYRINAAGGSAFLNRMERLSKGLLWAGVSTSNAPILFGLQAIAGNWPAATDASSPDSDYELFAPQIFRFEYFYLLKTGAISNLPGANGMGDVAAICVTVAAIDQKSRVLLSDSQVATIIGLLKDFDPAEPSYDLTTSWQTALDGISNMPRVAINGIRIYQRYFYLMPLK